MLRLAQRMGMTMQQLGDTMTAQEFGQHYVMELEEPLSTATFMVLSKLLAAIANGPLQPPAADRIWGPSDFMPDLWAEADLEEQPGQSDQLTVEQILARGRSAGMVH